mmetsp:Transcript_5716/g.9019  ORF Transcript_5716/g.9019 Transcript_5716/m.9019 type:complete len:93 (+) Transcript_5716:58-336(+)
MIIDAKTIIITLVIVLGAGIYGLKFIRQFALQIAQENHDAVVAMDQQEEQQRLKKERAADAAAAAFAKVEPILKVASIDEPTSKSPTAEESA